LAREGRRQNRLRLGEIASLPGLQGAILGRAAGLVASGGALLYVTCSVLPEENEAVVEPFLAAHPEFAIEGWMRIAPHTTGTDAFVVARLRHQG
jgi:16S rRNA (cytosine967-C5)-methyltransferase